MAATACKSCSYFEAEQSLTAQDGLCRLNPPVFLTEDELRGAWPTVKTDDWCGSHSSSNTAH
ncbi:hypothetical protein EDD53_1518 [Pacificibacter maritimus]|uniref:Uncharacterized protein n=1 Tax=Pacificibacter maritimus TaxID=762213 RepID=A0A3N4V2G9_9RHOB|nr:hypothetical protein [Pacificibacter maritimus]RPE67114.1 hypothetical protein EDD53_1518 [Pacificibacter maritimus]